MYKYTCSIVYYISEEIDIYNKMIKSLLFQSLENIEIIIVDSTGGLKKMK